MSAFHLETVTVLWLCALICPLIRSTINEGARMDASTPSGEIQITIPSTWPELSAVLDKVRKAGFEWIAADRKTCGPHAWYCVGITAMRNDVDADVLDGFCQRADAIDGSKGEVTVLAIDERKTQVTAAAKVSVSDAKSNIVKWGFDLTHFGEGQKGVDAFLKLLDEVGLPHEPQAIRIPPAWSSLPIELRDWLFRPPFVWSRAEIAIITNNNPVSGEYAPKLTFMPEGQGYSAGRDGRNIHGLKGRQQRKDELGYASYIGIFGQRDLVEKAAAFIRACAPEIKGESPESRGFI